jgi:hypothetical protein
MLTPTRALRTIGTIGFTPFAKDPFGGVRHYELGMTEARFKEKNTLSQSLDKNRLRNDFLNIF